MPQRTSYTFKEGLTFMAAKAVGIDPDLAVNAGDSARAAINALRHAAKAKNAKDKAALIREAQKEMQCISPAKHPKLVNALQARLLALQGRGQDTEVAHVARGEMVIPRELLTPEMMKFIAAQAQERGIDPRRLMVGGQASINPATGAEEFGFSNGGVGFGGWVKDKLNDLFGGPKGSVTVEPVDPDQPPQAVPPEPRSDSPKLNPIPNVPEGEPFCRDSNQLYKDGIEFLKSHDEQTAYAEKLQKEMAAGQGTIHKWRYLDQTNDLLKSPDHQTKLRDWRKRLEQCST